MSDELREVVNLLADMLDQYMGNRDVNGMHYITHEFMGAQEDSIEYFERIGWLKGIGMERYVWTEASGRGRTMVLTVSGSGEVTLRSKSV